MLALDITDMGTDDGVDVTIRDEASGRILFETVLADPDSRTLLTFGSPETETFWQCLQTHGHVDHVRHLFLTARCRFSLLNMTISTKRIGHAEVRNVAFLRLIEDVLDELRTREPGMSVEVAVTQRNPAFADFVRYDQE
ncbi:hypothetical protein MUY35_01085 [Aliiroseovarius sp. S1339]|uniref:hypothetical protein n=1 Tax=Aliiroseovarius sp. S1339 TaxID=2936990 RepID=UPI0020BE9513|nr:hypothetical protein [Aliiroseovarius sp. S1339]MCK8462440.1 hypothetical protein [Aliiroseovarius sp. S1339]